MKKFKNYLTKACCAIIIITMAESMTPVWAASDTGDGNEAIRLEETEKQELIDEANNEAKQADENGVEYSGFIVKLSDGTEAEKAAALEDDSSVEQVQFTDDTFTTDKPEDIFNYYDADEVLSIEPDYIVHASDIESDSMEAVDAEALNNDDVSEAEAQINDPYYSSYQWNLDLLNVPEVWDMGLEGNSVSDSDPVIVAVIDSGINYDHEDLNKDHILTDEGYSWVSTDTSDVKDALGHGTFCSGQIMATRNNGVGIAGEASDVYILPLRVFGTSSSAYTSDIVSAINYATNFSYNGKGVDVITMSLGGEGTTTVQEAACKAAVDSGILVVAAAGNDGDYTLNYPAAYDSVIGVGSVGTDSSHTTVSDFSQRGTTNVFVTAPGYKMVSTYYNSDNSYYRGSGTSFATPQLAALAAYMKSINRDITQDDFKNILIKTSVDLGSTGRDSDYGYGLVDFYAACEEAFSEFGGLADECTLTPNVVEEDGNAVSGATLVIKDSSNNVVTPNEDGTYSLTKGNYSYTVNAYGYVEASGDFSVYTAKRTLTIVLQGQPYKATVTPVNTNGDVLTDASITVKNAKNVAQTETAFGTYNLPVGNYTYSISCTDYYTQTGTFRVEPDTGAKVSVTVYGDIDVASATFKFKDEADKELKDAEFTLYNSNGGQVEEYKDGYYKLYPGNYTYKIVNDGFLDEKGSFEITDSEKGTTKEITLVMHDPIMWVYFENVPVYADVTVYDSNGETVSPESVGEYKLLKGDYTYAVSAEGYKTKTGSFTLTTKGMTIDTELEEDNSDGKVSVTYVSNGGSKINSSRELLGQKLEMPEDPVREGYEFAGWYKESSLTTPWNFDVDILTQAITLYAKWIPTEYKIIYMFNGQEITGLSPSSYNYGSSVHSLPTPEITGWHFEKWYTDSDLTNEATGITAGTSGTVTFYAKCTEDTGVYNITFDSNGGSDVEESTADGSTGFKIIKPKDPERKGYTFAGWFKDDELSNEWNFENDTVSWHTTLYARWSADSYTITYMDGNQTITGLTPLSYKYNEAVMALPEPPSKTGYTFGGWYSDSEFKVKVTSLPAGTSGNKILYAKWLEGMQSVPDDCDYEKGSYDTDYDNDGYPDVSEDGYTLIYDQDDLEKIEEDAVESGTASLRYSSGLRKKYRLAKSIMLTGEWEPLSGTEFFNGIFDGAGHIIAGLYLKSAATSQSLFGEAYYADISNLTLYGDVTGTSFIGGFTGESYYCTYKNLVNHVNVNSTGKSCGGIAGAAYHGSFYECINYGSVTCTGSVTTPTCIYATGGIVGDSGFSSELNVDKCVNYGNVNNASGTPTGGILGSSMSSSSSVTNCYNMGQVYQSGTDETADTYGLAAGVVGFFKNSGVVSNCYNAGKAVSDKQVYGHRENDGYDYLSAAVAFYGGSLPSASVNNYFLDDTCDSKIAVGKVTVESSIDGYVWYYTLSTEGSFNYSESNDYDQLITGLGDEFTADTEGLLNGGYPILKWQEAHKNTLTFNIKNAATDEEVNDCDVYVNGELIGKGNGAECNVESGWADFRIVSTGDYEGCFKEETGRVYVANDDLSVDVSLEAASYTFKLKVNPQDANVSLTNESLGTIEPSDVSTSDGFTTYTYELVNGISAGGAYSWSVSKYGYITQSGKTNAISDVTKNITLTEDDYEAVYFDVGPEDVAFSLILSDLDGNEISPYDGSLYHLTAGTYSYEIKADGYNKYTGSLTIPSTKHTISVTLKKDEGWTGESDTSWYDPDASVYHIKTADELAGLSELTTRSVDTVTFEGKTIYLDNDIELGGKEWTPIGTYSYDKTTDFKGTFDGQGHTISGLSCTLKKTRRALFGSCVDATIKNLKVYGNIESAGNSPYISGIIAYARGGDYEDLASYVNIECKTYHVGGVVGSVTSGNTIISRCVNYGTIHSSSTYSGVVSYDIGGVIGQVTTYGTAYMTTINNCANYGDVSAETLQSLGGVIGSWYVSSGTQIGCFTNCMNAGNLTSENATSTIGGVIGAFKGTNQVEVRNCLNLGTLENTASEDAASVIGGISGCVTSSVTMSNNFYRYDTASYGISGTDDVTGECTSFGSESDYGYDDTVSQLGESYTLNSSGEPVLAFLQTDSEFTVAFNVSYDNEANLSEDEAVSYYVADESEEYLVGKDGTVKLKAGTYRYVVDRVGYEPASGTFDVVDGSTEINVTLNATKYKLVYKCSPSDASLTLKNEEGTAIAPANVEDGVYTFNVINGIYTYSAFAYGFRNTSGTTEISFSDKTSETVTLEALPEYNISFNATDSETNSAVDAKVVIYYNGDIFTETTTDKTVALKEGYYKYTVRADGYQVARSNVTVSEDGSVDVSLTKIKEGDHTPDTDWYTDFQLNDEYTIYTAEELLGMAELINDSSVTFEGKTIILGNDIDISDMAWTPAGSYGSGKFMGTFDGAGYSISITNGTMSGTEGCFGLFGYCYNATIKNLIVKGNVDITTWNDSTGSTVIYVGGISGYAYGTTLKNVSNQMSIDVNSTIGSSGVLDIGGLLGWCGGVTLDSCSNIGTVNAECTSLNVNGNKAICYTGGLVGLGIAMSNSPITITNCYNEGKVTSSAATSQAAGIAAVLNSSNYSVSMKNCYNVGTINADTKGAICASSSISGIVRNNYYLDSSCSSNIGISKTSSEMKDEEMLKLLGDAYVYVENNYPMLSWEKQVTSVELYCMPDKSDYNDLEDFDDTGMKLKINYGTQSEIVTSGWTVEDGEALRVDREGSVKVEDGLYKVPVKLSFHGMETLVMVNVTQTVHTISADELNLDITAPKAGEKAESKHIETEKYSADVTWTYEGEDFTGTFETGKFYRAKVKLNAVSNEGEIYYAFDKNALPSCDNMLGVLKKKLNSARTVMTADLTFNATVDNKSEITESALHLYRAGDSDSRYDYSDLLDETLTISYGDESKTYTVRELEERMLNGGEGIEAEYSKYDGKSLEISRLTGISLYTLCKETGFFPDNLADSSVIKINDTELTWGQIRTKGSCFNAAGEATGEKLPALVAVAVNKVPIASDVPLNIVIPQSSSEDNNSLYWISDSGSVELESPSLLKQQKLVFTVTDAGENKLDGASITVIDDNGNEIKAQSDGTFLVNYGMDYSYFVTKKGYGGKSGVTGNIGGDTYVSVQLETTWDGTYTEPEKDTDGYYLIYNADELMWFNKNASNDDNARLMADICLNTEGDWKNVWEPMFYSYTETGYYRGTFDGNGHTIENLYMSIENLYTIVEAYDGSPMLVSTRTDIVGFMGYLSGTVKNLKITGRYEILDRPASEMADWFMLGGIAGFVSNGTIDQCSTDIEIVYDVGKETTTTGGYPDCGFPECCDTFIGGIAGSMSGGSVTNCCSSGDITGTGTRTVNVGGIAGGVRRAGSTITNCYSSGDIKVQGSSIYDGSDISYVGGIVGDSNVLENTEGATISACFALGGVIDGTNGERVSVGRIAGNSASAVLSNNYANEGMSVENVSEYDATAFLRANQNGANIEMTRATASLKPFTAVGWSSEIWKSDSDETLPTLLWEKTNSKTTACNLNVNMPTGTTINFTGGVTDAVVAENYAKASTTTSSTVTFSIEVPKGFRVFDINCEGAEVSFANGYCQISNITKDVNVVISVTYISGDINSDGSVDSEDVLLAKQFAAGMKVPSNSELERADVNGDGTVTATDAFRIKKIAG